MGFLLINVIVGVIVAAIASSKGRNVVGWFFCGFLVPVIGLIVILCISNLKDEQAHRARVDDENRRLREQLRQERIKAESFREHTQRRLDAHDDHMGVNTRTDNMLEGGPAPAGYLAAPAGQEQDPDGVPFAGRADAAYGQAPYANPFAAGAARDWYYEVDGTTQGPVPEHRLVEMLTSGAVRGSTLVWAEGLKDWTAAGRVPEFSAYARA